MPDLKPISIERVQLPSDENYWVDWRSHITYADVKAASAAGIANIAPNSAPTDMDTGAVADTMLLRYIADWNLDDEVGNVLPLTPESLAKIDGADALFLSAKMARAQEKRIDERKNS